MPEAELKPGLPNDGCPKPDWPKAGEAVDGVGAWVDWTGAKAETVVAVLGAENALLVCKLPNAPNPLAGLTREPPPNVELVGWVVEVDVVENDPNMLLVALGSVGCELPSAKPPNEGVESDIDASRVIVGESDGDADLLGVAGAPKLP